jgi:hypothetical protein
MSNIKEPKSPQLYTVEDLYKAAHLGVDFIELTTDTDIYSSIEEMINNKFTVKFEEEVVDNHDKNLPSKLIPIWRKHELLEEYYEEKNKMTPKQFEDEYMQVPKVPIPLLEPKLPNISEERYNWRPKGDYKNDY